LGEYEEEGLEPKDFRSETSEKYRLLYSPSVNFIIDMDGIVINVSKLSAGQLGYAEDEIIGKNVLDFVIPEQRERVKRLWERDFKGEYTPGAHVDVYAKDGTIHSIMFAPGEGVLYEDNKPTGIVLEGLDVTERKRAEERLWKSEERYRSLFEGVPVGLYRTTPDGSILDVNSALVQMLGYSDKASLLARNASLIFLDPGDRERWKKMLENDDVIFNFETQLQKLDGTHIWVKDSAKIVRDSDGRVLYYEGSMEDFTERKLAVEALKKSEAKLKEYTDHLEEEVHQRSNELIQSEKMASIGQLVAGVAHEINNPLSYLRSNSELILEQLEKLMDIHEGNEKQIKIFGLLERMVQTNMAGVDRIANLTKTLKRFAKPDVKGKAGADINEGIRDTVYMVFNQLKYRITVHEDYGTIPNLLCNIGHLNQVFMNVFLNASEAMDKGDIWIRTWYSAGDIFVEFKDNGRGISEDQISNIFNPFYTTKDGGTGLGLSICYRIIKDHNGEINAESQEGEGTTITIIIPVKEC